MVVVKKTKNNDEIFFFDTLNYQRYEMRNQSRDVVVFARTAQRTNRAREIMTNSTTIKIPLLDLISDNKQAPNTDTEPLLFFSDRAKR